MTQFKRGSLYTRQDIGFICLPETGRPSGGDWDTGYVRVERELIVFMNIGVPGRTQHDFDNEFDPKTGMVTWYSKLNKRSTQPLMKNLIAGDLTPHFFARWDANNSQFTYLGVGQIVNFQDDAPTKHGKAIKFLVSIRDAAEILDTHDLSHSINHQIEDDLETSFVMEKHLEDFLVRNWNSIPLSRDYEIYREKDEIVGQQFRTACGPIDILANHKNHSEFLVVELKRDRVSDVAVAQTQRYMGWVRENMCGDGQDVKGCIIGTKADRNLYYSIKENPKIQFLKYQVNFQLTSENTLNVS